MGYRRLRAEVDGGVGRLTLARPDAGNSIDLTMAEELDELTTAWTTDPGVRAVLVQGEGSTFCVGGDLKSFASEPDLPAHLTEITTHLHAAISRLAGMDAPVIAAVHGSAAGAGCSLAAVADLVLAGASSRFVMAYTAIGLTPDGSGSWSLPRVVGLRRALELTLTNRRLTAAEAVEVGLATRVVPDEDLRDEAEQLARSLAAGPTAALGAAKRLLRGSLANDLETQMTLEAEALALAAGSADGREGIAAFLEKRTPRFGDRSRAARRGDQ
jgi:2-(1,2-epoxy-1,2-dihydrophenyl)acetyl-CoA isomerase